MIDHVWVFFIFRTNLFTINKLIIKQAKNIVTIFIQTRL